MILQPDENSGPVQWLPICILNKEAMPKRKKNPKSPPIQLTGRVEVPDSQTLQEVGSQISRPVLRPVAEDIGMAR
jgi:hypothetical protein